ncbi:MAG: aspartate aminotransferase [Verrucomicrobia bacterium GWF2_51_19]|nr:MAG: aspartate aminotransferase [Verrucomicrobia bacterium GWF2_51_19]HCJ11934.1 aspartate aminotransferase [Opitutae bacterium]
MKQLSIWARQISPSLTLAISAKAKALKAAGKDICEFGSGEPDFDTPDFIKEACIQALRDGKTKYLPSAGLLPLRQAIAKKYECENGLTGLSEKNIIVSPGGKFSCHLAVMAVCSPGDEVLIPSPYWLSYPEMVRLAGATPIFLKTTFASAFKVTVDDLRAAKTDRTRLFILNSPSNPTGTVYSKEEICALVDYCVHEGIYVMSDEIYEALVYDGVQHFSPASVADYFPYVITTGGFSKTFAMTGWRLGYSVAEKGIAEAMDNLQSHMTSNATTFAQYGALAALQNEALSKASVESMRQAFDRRRKLLYSGLSAIDGMRVFKSQGAFYLFPSIENFGASSAFADKLLQEQQVAVVPGIAFGDDTCIRLSYATSDATIEKGIERLQTFCKMYHL